MKKVFVLTETNRKYGVDNLWYFSAEDAKGVAKQLLDNPRKYREILSGLGGEKWDVFHRHFDPPSEEEVLEVIDSAYGEYSRYQLFELDLEEQGQFQAPEIRHGDQIYPYSFNHPFTL